MDDLAGLRVLVVEDESLIALTIADALDTFGCELVASAATAERARAAVGSLGFDVALLDINLGGVTTFDLARELERKRVRFVFCTGQDGGALPPDLSGHPVLEKPFSIDRLEAALRLARSSAPVSGGG